MVMLDFGFKGDQLIGIILKPYYPHNLGDVYDPDDNFKGNTNVKCTNGYLETISFEKAGQHIEGIGYKNGLLEG
jgi:hypothetical protein